MENKLPVRKPTRLAEYSYSTGGAYFVTLCTQNRSAVLSRITGDCETDIPLKPTLLPYGKIAEKYLKQLNHFYNDIEIDQYVIMPNHIHILLFIYESGTSGTPSPTRQNEKIFRFISTFKRFCNKEFGENPWQRSFHDHVLRDRADYENHVRYIISNPATWLFDEFFTEE